MVTPGATFTPDTPWSRALGIIALVALAWSVYEGVSLYRAGHTLETASAPHRVISLALAPTTAHAQGIVSDWGCTPEPTSCPVVKGSLSRDTRFVAAYVLAWVLIGIWAHVAGGVSKKVVAALCAVVVTGGIVDLAENWLLGLAVGNAGDLPFARIAPLVPTLMGRVVADGVLQPDRVFTLARLAAMTKFVLLLGGMAGISAVAGGALRLFFGARRVAQDDATRGDATLDPVLPTHSPCVDEGQPLTDFEKLIECETAGIFKDLPMRPRDCPKCETHAAADEGYVAFREADVIGLSLSGGGIRSATFNLGLLQGLHAMGLLRLFDYLSTVSGGGYIGSFWSAWLSRLDATPGSDRWDTNLFPTTETPTQRDGRIEPDQVRHLREFSGFLAPRWGFVEVETWTAIVALLAGLVPAMLIGLSVIGMTLVAWLAFTFPLASRAWDGAPALAVGVIAAAVFYLFEKMWLEFKKETAGFSSSPTAAEAEAAARGRWRYRTFAGLAIALAMALQFALGAYYNGRADGSWPILRGLVGAEWSSAPNTSGLVRWWALTGIDNPGRPWIVSLRLFDYGVVWLATGLLLLLFVRTTTALAPRPWRRESLAAFDRVVMRVLGTGVVWIGMAVLWHVAINLDRLVTVVVGALISGGLFAALRNWIGVSLRRPAEAGVLDRLKPLLPSLLAYTTLALTAVTIGMALVSLAGSDWYRWWQACAGMATVLVFTSFISPEEFGLHAFYRDRIARAYSGATNLAPGAGAIDNRGTEPREHDDLPFSKLRSRPLHLVCCAANDLSGDQVETLGRGARSAVLSKYGFSLGQYARPWYPYSPGNRLASGITASAAAFNSNMGQISVRVGPAVSFLMTMLNLRLGLWVRHPLAHRAGFRRWPGLLFYREMLGLTSASGRIDPEDVPKSVLRDVHLSDGGHFENLALYELVRRHCRYILLSDCGADPDVAFDDLGNALRRVREDFGVDIELDVSALRPGDDRLSRQHVAVGTIYYAPNDVGILLYVKPTVTGDEPPDVQQYRTRNTAFPHEATTDQFYDEAQWESYRRLGLHAAQQVFDFVARGDQQGKPSADWVFAEARQRWGATPAGLEDRILEMTKRFGALEQELQQRKVYRLLRDVFPEVRYIPDTVRREYGPEHRAAGAPVGAGEGTADDQIAAELSVLLRVTQLMEDAWASCELDRWWRHPLNLGWINLFARWATSASFQFWWPLTAPMFSPGFRQFIEQRFPVRNPLTGRMSLPHIGEVRTIETPQGSGLTALWWQERSVQTVPWLRPAAPGLVRTFYENVLRLPREGVDVPIQAGMAAVLSDGRNAGWTSDDFFVPPSLWGAGIGGQFLLSLLDTVSESASRCHVVVKAPPIGQAHQVARDDRHAFTEQYRKMGFREARPGKGTEAGDTAFWTALTYDAERDTLLTLDLDMRKKRQARVGKR